MMDPLTPDALRWRVPAEDLAAASPPPGADRLLGQPVAAGVLRQVAEHARSGLHAAVVGLQGPRRFEHVAAILRGWKPRRRVSRDQVILHGFLDPLAPVRVQLPAGRGPALRDALAALGRELPGVVRGAVGDEKRVLGDDDRKVVREAIEPHFAVLADRFRPARTWLAELEEAVVVDAALVRDGLEGSASATLRGALVANVLHVGQRGRAAPIVIGDDPHPAVLLGGLAKAANGQPQHMRVRSGAVHAADGGFLIIDGAEVARDPLGWAGLKRVLRLGSVLLPGNGAVNRSQAAELDVEPVPVDVTVLLLMPLADLARLRASDPEFASLVGLRAELSPYLDYSAELVGQLAGWLDGVRRADALLPLASDGLGALVEWAGRQSGRGGRIWSDLDAMADLYREASLAASVPAVGAAEVRAALDAREAREGLLAVLARDNIGRGVLAVDLRGAVVGQVNGLAVYRSAGFSFGRPLRITANVGAGRGGFINIEREAGLSGKLHDKGVAVLAGLLRGRFGRQRTLAITASICFEQHYGRIDGDSASSAEAYALLSQLAGAPLAQGRAVTGSVDQRGNIQPIGSVNLKIEGFFAVCAEAGLTGDQGVLVPAANVPDLALSAEVVDACAAGRFHVWPVRTIEEGLALLSGMPAGDPASAAAGDDTVYGRVIASLDALEIVVRRAARGPDRNGPAGEE